MKARPTPNSNVRTKLKPEVANGADHRFVHGILVELVNEANKAFKLNTGLFAALDPKVAAPPAPPALAGLKSKSFPLATVAAFVLAACATHFMLVLGGYTGSSGTEKLGAFFEYLRGLVSAKLV